VRSKLTSVIQLLLTGLLCDASIVAKNPEKTPTPQSQDAPPSLALSPAVIMLKAQPGASSTHSLTISNLTPSRLKFTLEALDVVIRGGKRVFVPAGEAEGGIARSALFEPRELELNSGGSAEVRITLTVPQEPKVRAVAAIFHGLTAISGNGTLMFTGSLGTLITYNLSEAKAKVRTATPTVAPQTASSNFMVSEELENDGSEPSIPSGTLAILKDSGALLGRVAAEPHRLLPGEKFNFTFEYPQTLRPGAYRAMMSFKDEGGVQTNSIEFRVP
jgi:hypothetical protein